MITAAIQNKQPVFDTLPAATARYFPKQDGSFKPFLHARLAAVPDSGLYVNLTVFENIENINIPKSSDILQNCCAAITLAPPEGEKYIQITCDIHGAFLAQLCLNDKPVEDITAEFTAAYAPQFSGGNNEIGVYWSNTFLLPDAVIHKYFGAPLNVRTPMRGNAYILCQHPDMYHFGTVSPVADEDNHSPYRLDGFDDIVFLQI